MGLLYDERYGGYGGLKKAVDLLKKADRLFTVMTLTQFQAAFAIAKDFDRDLSNVDDSILYGYGLASFRPVHTTLEAVAKTIRWQALQMNGEWDAEALNEVAEAGRKNFLVLG